MKKKITLVVGTRPEAIKIAPLYLELIKNDSFYVNTINSGQHGSLINQVFKDFNWKPDVIFKFKKNKHSLSFLYSSLFKKFNDYFNDNHPDLVIVHGDTATTAVVSMVAFLYFL